MQPDIFFNKLWSLALGLGLALSCGTPTQAASHREAPLIAQDPAADITDVYAFRSWEDPSRVVLIMNVIPAQEPSSGPNYFFFDDQVAYDFNLDIDQDGMAEDIIYRVQFKTEIRPPFDDLPVSYAGVDPVPGLPPAITDLDGPGATGLGLRQTYTVTQIQAGKHTVLAEGLFAVPSNIGPQTMPDYEKLAEDGIFPLSNGGRVFVGQRDETFYIDLGATFDTLNFRAAPILSDVQDADDGVNPFGNDMFSGFNVNTIALEIPISELSDVIGMYASTSRPKTEIHAPNSAVKGEGDFVQVARMGNPLVNELIIGTGMKDSWNGSDPKEEAQFLDFYLNPRLVTVINLAFGTDFPTTNRTDLVAALLQYSGQDPNSCLRSSRCSELLRLDTKVEPTSPESQKRLGGLVDDAAGFPNGRRPNDDVTDIILRVAAGALLGAVPNLGDGVNFNIGAPGTNVTDKGIYTRFPFLPTPFDGRTRRHIDCGEEDANPCN
jgi:Domain of unknown function (DUF4331)